MTFMQRFINILAKKGDRGRAECIMHSATEWAVRKAKTSDSPETLLAEGVRNAKVALKMKRRWMAKRFRYEPAPASAERVALAIRLILSTAHRLCGRTMPERLARTLTAAYEDRLEECILKGTMEQARAVLGRAQEQTRGEGRTRRARRAAENVWTAAVIAAEAMAGAVLDAYDVIRAFERAWGREGRELAGFLEIAFHHASRLSFAAACDGALVQHYASQFGQLLNTPIRDAAIRRRLALRDHSPNQV